MRLGPVILGYRLANRVGQRELAGDIGIAPSTLQRIESGASCDSGSVGKILGWLLAEGAMIEAVRMRTETHTDADGRAHRNATLEGDLIGKNTSRSPAQQKPTGIGIRIREEA